MEKIMPVNYLTVENFERYRLIMRYFYKRHRQMQGSLYRPDILEMMQQAYSPSYSELEVDQDLENLVLWKNLQKQQEVVRPRSIEEYRNKNFRYQITKAGILVEEMVYQLAHEKQAARGALDEGGFRKLLQLVTDLVDGKADPVELWLEIRQIFGQIREETANYIGYITSPEVDSRMKTEAFLIYKDKFVNYLRDFIVSVQNLYFQFQTVVEKLPQVNRESLIKGLYDKEQEVPTLDGMTEAEVGEQVAGEFEALHNWFIASGSHPSEYDNLMEQTNEMIAKITNLIYYFGQEIQQYQSRKKDYLQLAKWFAQAEDLAQAQKIYAGIFGLEHSRHFYVSEGTTATNTKEVSWDLEPSKLLLNKRGRGLVMERKASSFKMNLAEQLKQQEKFRRKITQQRKKINSYFKKGILDFAQVRKLDAESRQVFLKWISSAIASQAPERQKRGDTLSQLIPTELDFTVKVKIDRSRQIVVDCTDGKLTMPHVIMERRV